MNMNTLSHSRLNNHSIAVASLMPLVVISTISCTAILPHIWKDLFAQSPRGTISITQANALPLTTTEGN
jgi:hypothetical protein